MRRHLSVVLVALLIVACVGETGPTGPQGSRGTAGLDGRDGQDGRPGPAGPAGEPLNWADVLEEHRVNEATYVLLYTYTHRDGKRYYDMFCTGFAAYYTGVVWTNAHCVDAALERARELRGADPHFFIVRAETPIGGDQTYAIDLGPVLEASRLRQHDPLRGRWTAGHRWGFAHPSEPSAQAVHRQSQRRPAHRYVGIPRRTECHRRGGQDDDPHLQERRRQRPQAD